MIKSYWRYSFGHYIIILFNNNTQQGANIMEKTIITRYELTIFYKSQLRKFYLLGIGNKTENRVVITQTLINATNRRLKQLQAAIGQIEIA